VRVQTNAQSVGEVQMQLTHDSLVMSGYPSYSVEKVLRDGPGGLGGYDGTVFYWHLRLFLQDWQPRQIERESFPVSIDQQVLDEDTAMATGRLLATQFARFALANDRIGAKL
jgi:hypothetical protein